MLLVTALTGTSTGSSSSTNAACVVASNDTPPTGAVVVTYNVVSVGTTSVNGVQRPTITFSISLDGIPTSFNTNTTGQLFPNFVGSPSVQFAWGCAAGRHHDPGGLQRLCQRIDQDIWNGTATGTGAGRMVSSASPTYTITLTGLKVASNAKLLTGGLGATYSLSTTPPLTQTTGYTIADPTVASACTFSQTVLSTGFGVGGLIVPAPDKSMAGTGYTGRRIAVEPEVQQMSWTPGGIRRSHAGQRNDGRPARSATTDRTSSGW